MRYTGEYWDETTGLQYLRARWYDPGTARFMGEDTYKGELEDPLSQNLYTYVENNPLIYVDPSGNSPATAKSCALLCFAAGTIIETQDGPKAIEEIEVGDYVLAQSEVTGELDYKPVEETYHRVTEETYHIQVEDTVIVTTAEHPFWVIGKGWVESRDLKAGDRLVNDEGIEYVIEKIEIKQETIRVYNFSVGDYHTYFVTGLKLWTHNCGGSGGRGAGGGAGGSGGFVPRIGGGGGTSLPKKVTSPKQKQKPVVNLPQLNKQLQKAIAQFQKNRSNLGKRQVISAGKNFKDHFIRHKIILEKALGTKYPKFKTHGDEFLKDIGKTIDNGTVSFVGRGTLKKDGEILNIYRGKGMTIATKPNGEFVTILESGKGMDLNILFIP